VWCESVVVAHGCPQRHTIFESPGDIQAKMHDSIPLFEPLVCYPTPDSIFYRVEREAERLDVGSHACKTTGKVTRRELWQFTWKILKLSFVLRCSASPIWVGGPVDESALRRTRLQFEQGFAFKSMLNHKTGRLIDGCHQIGLCGESGTAVTCDILDGYVKVCSDSMLDTLDTVACLACCKCEPR
jgi:hypothetical protein